MARLHLFAEGVTEQTFASTVLKPYLIEFGVYAAVQLIAHARKKGKVHRGGGRSFLAMQNDIRRRLGEKSEDLFVTTMIDLYALPKDFPGREEAERLRHDPYARVARLEQSWAELTDDARFIPFLQLHEYETYLFSGLEKLAFHFGSANRGIRSLLGDLEGVDSPERINDGPHTAPSKRIIRQFPGYEKLKTTVGPQMAEQIGLVRIRETCPHFDTWVSRLEQLGSCQEL